MSTRTKAQSRSITTLVPYDRIIPAAQYVRMSDDAQQFSIDNQKSAIQEYAVRHHFSVVKTYADAGKSGVMAKNRPALRELLKDVVNGNTPYEAILVYDVSRWGRFPNSDEAAHYEFLCSSSGVPLHYCAEQFANDGTASNTLLKALKRSMAAEFSRELGEKVFRGKSRIVQLGFWVGGSAGYGYQRQMVSQDGKQKRILKNGEHKSLTTDRVTLILGSRVEVACVREIFAMTIDGLGCTAIAKDLNRRGKFKASGRPWYRRDIYNIVTNPKYAGTNVWYRHTQRLRAKQLAVDSQHWINKPAAFPHIVDQQTFDRAQETRPRRADSLWSDEKIIKKLRRLLMAKGYLSERLIIRTKGTPSTSTLRNHFGTLRRAYEAIGYRFPPYDHYRGPNAESSLQLRRKLVKQLSDMFPEHIRVISTMPSGRSILEVDGLFKVAILLCRSRQRSGGRRFWVVQPTASERENLTLLCKIDAKKSRITNYYLLPPIDIDGKIHYSYRNDPALLKGICMLKLSDFYAAINKLQKREANAPEAYPPR